MRNNGRSNGFDDFQRSNNISSLQIDEILNNNHRDIN